MIFYQQIRDIVKLSICSIQLIQYMAQQTQESINPVLRQW